MRKRQALLDLDAELWFAPRDDVWLDSLPRVIDALKLHGISIVGSAGGAPAGMVRLVIEGDTLPEECDRGWRVVTPALQQQSHGSQRIVRVEGLRVISREPFVMA